MLPGELNKINDLINNTYNEQKTNYKSESLISMKEHILFSIIYYKLYDILDRINLNSIITQNDIFLLDVLEFELYKELYKLKEQDLLKSFYLVITDINSVIPPNYYKPDKHKNMLNTYLQTASIKASIYLILNAFGTISGRDINYYNSRHPDKQLNVISIGNVSLKYSDDILLKSEYGFNEKRLKILTV
jgi:hypothetical protein